MSKLVAFITAAIVATGVLVPVVAYAYGVKNGPCSVSVTCRGGTTISCGGQTVCYWKGDALSSPGFVECDSQGRVYCDGGLIE
jgi:hypothetical protein